MSIWQRIAGTFQEVGDSVTGYFGSTTPPEKSVAFTIGMIALSAKMAKADGTVTRDEVAAFGQVFQVPEKDRPAVARVFDLAKQDIAGFESYARQVAALDHDRRGNSLRQCATQFRRRVLGLLARSFRGVGSADPGCSELESDTQHVQRV